MCGTAISELYTEQWVPVLLKNIGNPILIVTATSGIMVIGRGLAKPVLRQFEPQTVLFMSTVIASIGLYLLYASIGNTFVDAIIFGVGVCFFWPTMLGFVNINLPKTGALGLNLMGGAGMFAVSIYTIYMGKYYDSLVQQSNGDTSAAGKQVLYITHFIPIALIIAFAGLVIYMRSRNKSTPMQQAAA